MGNNQSHDGSPKRGISRNNSGIDLQDKAPTQLLPLDKLAKVSNDSSQIFQIFCLYIIQIDNISTISELYISFLWLIDKYIFSPFSSKATQDFT